jgi:hypothetical protein
MNIIAAVFKKERKKESFQRLCNMEIIDSILD